MSKEKAKDKLRRYEFYKVIDDLHEKAFRIEVLPNNKKCAASALAKTCRNTYGPGDYVALELPESDGLANAGWYISKETGKAVRVKLPSATHEALKSVYVILPARQGKTKEEDFSTDEGLDRQVMTWDERRISFENYSYPTVRKSPDRPEIQLSPYAWQRGAEANAIASHFKNLPATREKKGGRPRDLLVDIAKVLQNKQVAKKERIKILIEKQQIPGEEYSSDQLQAFEKKADSADLTARTRRNKGV